MKLGLRSNRLKDINEPSVNKQTNCKEVIGSEMLMFTALAIKYLKS